MKHVVVDLEMNKIRQKSEARRICTQETIEIGAVMLDDNLQEVASFRTYVKPEYNDGIDRKISRLTGITDEMVMNAPLFNDAFRMFTKGVFSWYLNPKFGNENFDFDTTDWKKSMSNSLKKTLDDYSSTGSNRRDVVYRLAAMAKIQFPQKGSLAKILFPPKGQGVLK